MKHDSDNVPGIVIKAEAEMPECLARFCKGIKTDLEAAVAIGTEAKIKAWNIARRCFEHGNDADIKFLTKLYNDKNQKEHKGGAPMKPHRFLMNKLVERGWITKRTSYRWVNEWMEAAERAKLATDCTEKEFSDTVSLNLAAMLESEETDEKPAAKKDDGDPEEKIGSLAQKLESALLVTGEDGVVKFSIPRFRAALKFIAPLLKRGGYTLLKDKNQKGPDLDA